MRVLLDECLPRRLGREFLGHDVRTVAEVGWSGVKNGELLKRASDGFDALVTIDKRFAEGQVVPPSLALITLVAKSNRLDVLKPLIPQVLQVLERPARGERVRVGG